MEDYIFCSSCGRRIEDYNSRLPENGGYMCAACADEYCRRCDECGRLFLRNWMTEEDGNYYCNDCWDDLFAECSICGLTLLREKFTVRAGEYICPECMEELMDKPLEEPDDEPAGIEPEEPEKPVKPKEPEELKATEKPEDTVPEPIRDEAAPEKGKEREDLLEEIEKLENSREYLMSQVLRLTDEIRELEKKLNGI